MTDLELIWETFDFLTINIAELEAQHLNNVDTTSIFFATNKSPTREQKDRLRNKLNKCLDGLLVLYAKQIKCIDELIILNNSDLDIPEERGIDSETLIALKNVTFTLLEQMKLARVEYESFFI